MIKRRMIGVLTVTAAACAALSGCAPTSLPQSTASSGTLLGKAAAVSAYSQLSAAVSKSSSVHAYAVEYHAYWVLAGAKHDISGSAVVRGQRMLVITSADGVGFHFYQSGSQAYVDHSGTWTPTKPLPTVNLFAAYRNIVQKGLTHQVQLRKLPQQYLGGEENEVLQMDVPAAWLQISVPPSATSPEPHDGSVRITLYVGKQSHLLRFIQTSGAEPESGANAALATNIEFYYDAAHTVLQSPVR